ncbi:hypothetical protein COO58_14360 [Micromonospora sp. WMMA1996]|nr:hypothetical protein COO58_14360 [Micromonospora sp. WMMA1996]
MPRPAIAPVPPGPVPPGPVPPGPVPPGPVPPGPVPPGPVPPGPVPPGPVPPARSHTARFPCHRSPSTTAARRGRMIDSVRRAAGPARSAARVVSDISSTGGVEAPGPMAAAGGPAHERRAPERRAPPRSAREGATAAGRTRPTDPGRAAPSGGWKNRLP